MPQIIKSNVDKEIYDIYVTSCLQATANGIARFVGCKSDVIKKSYRDVIDPKPQDTRTGAEIAADVIKKAGLVVKTK